MSLVAEENELCSCHEEHPELVQKVRTQLAENSDIDKMSEFFKMFADSSRLKIILSLLNNELCVCDLTSVVQMNQSAVSHQLRVLKMMRLVKSRREGKVVFYSLDDEHVHDIVALAKTHFEEEAW
ncbi:MAG TPA: metalloregulator ArsR/SmtB family transcription factor [Candidatus Cloacimonadota bacterium]|nr:metalloregulator ArsR/SmtB family transcription factor [Candidatus Cloacimonadota bacterium]